MADEQDISHLHEEFQACLRGGEFPGVAEVGERLVRDVRAAADSRYTPGKAEV